MPTDGVTRLRGTPEMSPIEYRVEAVDLPVPSSDVSMIEGDVGMLILTTTTGQLWWYASVNGQLATWNAMPPVPNGPIGVEAESFGTLKSRFRGR